MRNFISLVKVNILSLFKQKKRGKKGLISSSLGPLSIMLIIGAVIAVIGYAYTKMFLELLSIYGRETEVLSYITAFCGVLGFFIAFSSSYGVLYGYKDYNLLFSMPIKTTTIVLSKVVSIFAFNFLISLLVIIASFFAYGSSFQLSTNLIIKTLIIVLFSQVFVVSLACILSMILAYISSFFKNKNAIQTVLYVLIFVGIFVFSFLSGSSENEMMVLDVLVKIFFVYPLTFKAVTNNLYLLIVVFGSLLSFFIVFALITVSYKKMNSIVTAIKKSKNFKLKKYNGKSEFSALLKKDIKTLFSYPIYAVQVVFGGIMTLIISIVSLFVFNIPEIAFISQMISRYIPVIACFVLFMAPTTYCSVSIEGKTFYLLKTMPIENKSFFNSKLCVNYIINALPSVISAILFSVAFKLSVLDIILTVALFIAILLCSSGLGLFFDIIFPNFTWEHPNRVVKQSVSCFLMVIVSFLFSGLTFLLCFFTNVELYVILILLTAFFLLLFLILYLIIMNKGMEIINKRS